MKPDKTIERACVVCGKAFFDTPQGVPGKYCSRACQRTVLNARQLERTRAIQRMNAELAPRQAENAPSRRLPDFPVQGGAPTGATRTSTPGAGKEA
jgi:predicted nucleic acid-binding Zn ribbon protein